MSYTNFLKDSLEEASEMARSYFGNVTAQVKADDNNQVLTEADLAIGDFLISRAERVYPEYNIIGEERGVIDKGSRYTWVIDPIDGTSNFATGSDLYGIMMGLLEDDRPIAGGIALPSFSRVIVASHNEGAYDGQERLHVSREDCLSDVLVAVGVDGYPDDPGQTERDTARLKRIIPAIRNLRISNSAYDLVMIAQGTYGAQLNTSSKIWDNVAQQIIVEEAGGMYTDHTGKPMDYSNPLMRTDQNFTWMTGSHVLHEKLLELTQ